MEGRGRDFGSIREPRAAMMHWISNISLERTRDGDSCLYFHVLVRRHSGPELSPSAAAMKTTSYILCLSGILVILAGCGPAGIPPTTAATGTNAHSIDDVALWV